MASQPFKVKAVFEYGSPHDDDLSFPNGQIITVTDVEDADWYVGEYVDATGAKQEGLFPKNFVERYEPEIPSRPTRTARPKSGVVSALPSAAAPTTRQLEPGLEPRELSAPAQVQPKPQGPPVEILAQQPQDASAKSPNPVASHPTPVAAPEPSLDSKPAKAPAPASAAAKQPPPPVSEKPSSFRDRIAAFNKSTDPPIAPFKPGGMSGGGTDFIKKPFVAPPPSRNAYVSPPKADLVPKSYRREEDPEIAQRQEEDRAAAEAVGLAPSDDAQEPKTERDEDAPKPLTLKERMALLQREQMEQGQRRAEAGHKKPRPPPKKRTESLEQVYTAVEGEETGLEGVRTSEHTERQSLEGRRETSRLPSTHRPPTMPTSQEQDVFSDGNEADQSAAGETTDDNEGTGALDDSDEKRALSPRAAAAPKQEPDVGDEDDTTEGEDDSMDEEARRKLELRERMAKMSGGMGMAGMFGQMPMATPPKKSTSKSSNRGVTNEAPSSSQESTQRMPMMAMPGLQRVRSPESEETQLAVEKEDEPEMPVTGERNANDVTDVEDLKPAPPARRLPDGRGEPPPVPQDRPVPQPPGQDRGVPPRVPGERPAPRQSPAESRPVPPPPPRQVEPSAGEESDDEMSMHDKRSSVETPSLPETPLAIRGAAPAVPGSREVPPRPEPRSPQSPDRRRTSNYFSGDHGATASATPDKRSSRVPPLPGAMLTSSSMSPGGVRPPPPPPPTAAPPSRQNSADALPQLPSALDAEDRGESEYEGDYDTDIASSAKHKDALKSHAREASLDESTTADDTPMHSPQLPAQPPPSATQPRAFPPPPPQQAPKSRLSMDAPRAPPPIPPARGMPGPHDADYDPYHYAEANRTVPPVPNNFPAPPPPPRESEQTQHNDSSDDMYSASPPKRSMDRLPPMPPQAPPQERAVPLPPSQQAPPPNRGPPRQSLDVQTATVVRRSMEQSRPSGEHGSMATEVDLGEGTQWWTAPSPLPPVFQARNGIDILSECEESSTSKRGGKTTIVKDTYVLFTDYSQTVITARYDSRDASDCSLEQRHEPSPPRLRQDQLESYWQRFGIKIAEAVGNLKKDAVVGDGTPNSLVLELIKAQPDALQPVGTRAYGAPVYANLANASVQQHDEIRPGDIITLRNAKLQGKHGTMHQKYSQDVGMGGIGHVGIVVDWDGTKKKVRAWEQGRERSKVRVESFRLGDLRSGEVRVWRIVGREWVGWDSNA